MSETLPRPFTAFSFNQFLNEKKLMGSQCIRCGELYLPPRAICPKCHADAMEWVELRGQGKLAAFTSVYIAPTDMVNAGYGRDNPYLTGIVELEEGVKISARILGVDPKEPMAVQVGLPLQVDFIEQGEDGEEKTLLAFQVAA